MYIFGSSFTVMITADLNADVILNVFWLVFVAYLRLLRQLNSINSFILRCDGYADAGRPMTGAFGEGILITKMLCCYVSKFR